MNAHRMMRSDHLFMMPTAPVVLSGGVLARALIAIVLSLAATHAADPVAAAARFAVRGHCSLNGEVDLWTPAVPSRFGQGWFSREPDLPAIWLGGCPMHRDQEPEAISDLFAQMFPADHARRCLVLDLCPHDLDGGLRIFSPVVDVIRIEPFAQQNSNAAGDLLGPSRILRNAINAASPGRIIAKIPADGPQAGRVWARSLLALALGCRGVHLMTAARDQEAEQVRVASAERLRRLKPALSSWDASSAGVEIETGTYGFGAWLVDLAPRRMALVVVPGEFHAEDANKPLQFICDLPAGRRVSRVSDLDGKLAFPIASPKARLDVTIPVVGDGLIWFLEVEPGAAVVKVVGKALPPVSTTPANPVPEIAQPVLPPIDHDRSPLLRAGITEDQAKALIDNAWVNTQSLRSGEPLREYYAALTRRLIDEALRRWPKVDGRVFLLQNRLLAGERLPGIERGRELWEYAQAFAVREDKSPDDSAVVMEIARRRLHEVELDRQEELLAEYIAELKPFATGIAAASLRLQDGIAKHAANDFPGALAAFIEAAGNGTGQVRRAALTWRLAMGNQFLKTVDILEAADALLADHDLPAEGQARALCSRAHALHLTGKADQALVVAREVIARFPDNRQYVGQAKDLIKAVAWDEEHGKSKEKAAGENAKLAPAGAPSPTPAPTPAKPRKDEGF